MKMLSNYDTHCLSHGHAVFNKGMVACRTNADYSRLSGEHKAGGAERERVSSSTPASCSPEKGKTTAPVLQALFFPCLPP